MAMRRPIYATKSKEENILLHHGLCIVMKNDCQAFYASYRNVYKVVLAETL